MTKHKKVKKHKKAEWCDDSDVRDLPDGSYINSHDCVCYVKNGRFHREGGPAIEDADGSKDWFINGKRHREDGPAVEWDDGTKWWCKNGKLHREDGPAMEYYDGYRSWYINGEHYTETAYEEALKVWKMNEAIK